MPRNKSHNNIQRNIDTKNLRGFLLEAGVDASVTAHVMAAIDEYLGCPESESFNCYLVQPAALALHEDCIDDYILDVLAHIGDPDW